MKKVDVESVDGMEVNSCWSDVMEDADGDLEGRRTVSVWEVLKDVKASGREGEGLVVGGGVVVD